MATSTNTLWLAADGIEWLVMFVADAYNTGGVPVDPPSAVGSFDGNCAAPGVRIQWDFDGAWDATIRRAEQAGQTCKSMVEKLTTEKWTVVAAVHHCGTGFESATPGQQKQATFHFLELHMHRALA